MGGAYCWRNMNRSSTLNNLLWWPTKKIRLDASELSAEKMDHFIKQYNKLKPKLLQGYVGAVHHLATYVKENNIKVVKPQAIWVTAAVLEQSQRQLIESVFGGPCL